MVCEHLRPLEHALAAAGIAVGFRGQTWSEQCREWVYYSAVLDMKSIRPYLPDCVEPHENLDLRSGQERGFYCTQCHDAVMGLLKGGRRFRMPPRKATLPREA